MWFCFIFYFLAAPHSMQGLSPPTRDQTCASCIGSAETKPLDHKGSPKKSILVRWWEMTNCRGPLWPPCPVSKNHLLSHMHAVCSLWTSHRLPWEGPMTAPQHCSVWPEIPDIAVILEIWDWSLVLKDRPVRRDLRGNWGTERAPAASDRPCFSTPGTWVAWICVRVEATGTEFRLPEWQLPQLEKVGRFFP